MNPLTNVKNLQKLNERELHLGIAGSATKSWHQKYKDSAWIFVGGLPFQLSEGDVISVFSQYGEIVNINLIRDRNTGKSRGFGFICYEDQKSTVLAVDNFNGIKLLNRIIRVDHVEEYKVPKEHGDEHDIVKRLHMEGCAPTVFEQNTTQDRHERSPDERVSVKVEPKSSRKAREKSERHVSPLIRDIKKEQQRSSSRSPERRPSFQTERNATKYERSQRNERPPSSETRNRHYRCNDDDRNNRKDYSRDEASHRKRSKYDSEDVHVPRRYK